MPIRLPAFATSFERTALFGGVLLLLLATQVQLDQCCVGLQCITQCARSFKLNPIICDVLVLHPGVPVLVFHQVRGFKVVVHGTYPVL